MKSRFLFIVFAAFFFTASFVAAFHFAEAIVIPPKACVDGADNDGDGLTDLADFGCTNADDNDERFPECFDGIDNDSDGLIDFPSDPQCSAITDTDEWHPSQCTDGVDNDGNTKIDNYDYPGCSTADPIFGGMYIKFDRLDFNNSERIDQCSDGSDNDGDGKIDYPEDSSCTSAADTDEYRQEQCRDDVDNDGDTGIDKKYPGWPGFLNRDLDCALTYQDFEYGTPQCADGADNDGDGLIDLDDPGCLRTHAGNIDGVPYNFVNDERNECKDGIDNDGDHYYDYPDDDGCFSSEDNSENDKSQCWDGRDNDGDGFIDYGEDLGCVSALYDNDEREQCDDDVDNDNDYQRDYLSVGLGSFDRGCASKSDNDELNPTQCVDGIDNDSDGKIDYGADSSNDPGCSNIYDNNEKGQCQDGKDNDGDGEVDYYEFWWGGDDQCSSSADGDESAYTGGGDFAYYTRPSPSANIILSANNSRVSSIFDFDFVTSNTNNTESDDIFRTLLAHARNEFDILITKIAHAAQPGPPTVNLSVAADPQDQDTVEIVTTEAYDTRLNIAWAATNACSCVGSKSPNNSDWWAAGGGAVGEALYHNGDIVVDVADTPQVEYTLTCYGFLGVNCDTNETLNPAAVDTVTVTPMWNPWWQTAVDLTGPAEAASGDNVTLNYEFYDIKECVATSPNGTWWGAAQNDEIKTSNIQPREGGGSIGVGSISRQTVFSLSCLGFDNQTHTDDIIVRYVPPVPFFSVTTVVPSQTILVTLGTGAGTISSKAALEVYAGGGFASIVNLSASGIPVGFTSHFSQASILCSGGASRCGTSDFWVEMSGSGQTDGVYPITITATAVSDGSTKTTTVNLRVRRFTPAFEEI